MKTPITIITGYLGAGKTTLLRNIIDKTDQKLAIIMNEFGELDIDGKIIKGKNIDMKELQGGCVCCSMTGEFEEAIKELIKKVNPDAIVVETTGVAEPDGIIVEINDNLPQVRIDGIITIADADSMARFPKIGHTAETQIEMADIILLNKIDIVDEKKLNGIEEQIKEINEHALIIHTKNCDVNIDILFGINAKKAARGHEHHEPKEDFFSMVLGKIDLAKFEEFVESMPKEAYRAKGFILFEGGSSLFNYVAGRINFEKFDAKRTEIVFIGKNLDKIKDKMIEKIKEMEIKV